jgi:hypothetical protein
MARLDGTVFVSGGLAGTRMRARATSFNFSKAGIYQNIEEFLATKAHQGAEGRNKALLHASFVRLLRLCG